MRFLFSILITVFLIGCGGSSDQAAVEASQIFKPRSTAQVTSPTANQITIVRLYQALHGKAPGYTIYNSYLASAETDPSALAKTLADAFSGTSDEALAKLVLDNIDVTTTTVNATSYALLLDAVGQFFAAYGSAARGQIILNLTTILATLGNDGAYGTAASLYNQRTLASHNYSSVPTNTAPVAVALTTSTSASFISIKNALDSLPPSTTGKNEARSKVILDFDTILAATDEKTATPPDIINYYALRTSQIEAEIESPVIAGFKVWSLYNHGFIIKTPTTIFAFDLVEGKSNWNGPAWNIELPRSIINKIDILFVSHEHGDHYDDTERIPSLIKSNGGTVVYPRNGALKKNTTKLMVGNELIQLKDLQVRTFNGLHNVPNLVYEITTAAGYKIVHTGDTQTSLALPNLEGVDLLLLNGWINEGGQTDNLSGMKNALDKLRPNLMIPGHFEELAHPKSGPEARYHYIDAIPLQDSPIARSKTIILSWGEHITYNVPTCTLPAVRIYSECKSPGSLVSDVTPNYIYIGNEFSINSPNVPSGMTIDDSNIWVVNNDQGVGQKIIAQYERSSGNFLRNIPAPFSWSSNICFDGLDIWVTGYSDQNNALYKISKTDGAILVSYKIITSSSAHRSAGLACDGKVLYYSEAVNNPNTGVLGSTIYRIDPSTGKTLEVVYTSSKYVISGLTYRNRSFWFISSVYTGNSIINKLVNISLDGAEISSKDLPVANMGGLTSGYDFLLYIEGRNINKINIFDK